MNHDGRRRRQQEVLRAVVALCREDAHVLGVTVAGSFARGENDAFSDVDMECYLVDEARTGVAELHQRMSGLARHSVSCTCTTGTACTSSRMECASI